jgi:hypothetical protein
MKYNPNEIAKWQNIGQKIKLLLLQTTLKNQTLCIDMFPSEQVARRASLGYIALMCMQDIKDIKVLMYCTQWAMTVLDCRLNNMPFKLATSGRYDSVNIDGGFDKEGNKIAG